jgi:Uncharacterized conserved protein (DUF2276).
MVGHFCMPIDTTNLHWHDMAYNQTRRIRLGGLVGSITLAPATLSVEQALALVMGQYTGAGKNGRFGFGLYQIAELEEKHTFTPFPSNYGLLQAWPS